MSKTAILIPARLKSQRLPKKLLLPLGNTTVLGQCLQRVKAGAGQCPIVVATDSIEIAQEAERHQVEVCLTPATFISGSDRIAHVATQRQEPFILNVQADEAFIEPSTIQQLITHRVSSEADIVSSMTPITEQDIFLQSSMVKVVCDHKGHALYFSRAPIPYTRKAISNNGRLGFGHIGLYAYTRSALLKFAALPPSPLEQQEGLEQLRALYNGMSIEMVEMANDHLSIDTQADYEQAKRRLETR